MTKEDTDNKLQRGKVERNHRYMLSLEMQGRKFKIKTSYGR